MDNFFFGLQGIFISVLENIRLVFAQELFWGFCLGFFLSTCVHLYLMTDSPDHLPHLILQNEEESFAHIHNGKKPEDDQHLFSAHIKSVRHAKFLSILFVLLLCLGLFIGLFHL